MDGESCLNLLLNPIGMCGGEHGHFVPLTDEPLAEVDALSLEPAETMGQCGACHDEDVHRTD